MNAREKLIAAARQCLVEKGHAASSVKAIAGRAGVNHGLVHHYFGSKEALWLEVIRREAEQIRALMAESGAGWVGRFLVPEFIQRPERARLIIEALTMTREYPSISGEVREIFRLRRAQLQEMLGLPDPESALLAFAAIFGLVVQSNVEPKLPVEAAAKKMLSLVSKPRG